MSQKNIYSTLFTTFFVLNATFISSTSYLSPSTNKFKLHRFIITKTKTTTCLSLWC